MEQHVVSCKPNTCSCHVNESANYNKRQTYVLRVSDDIIPNTIVIAACIQ